jgi:putative transposase
MSRQLRLQYPGSLWQITVRGNGGQDIYFDDDDRRFFIDLLGTCVTRFDWLLYGYVLMSNHFQLMLQLTSQTLSTGMHWLNSRSARIANRRRGRVGHLYQGRFKAYLIERETYFLEVLRYLVLGPVRAGMVTRPKNYQWSSHRATLGIVEPPDWLAINDVLTQFAPHRDIARSTYRYFIDSGIGSETSPWDNLVGIYLGTEPWMQRVREQLNLKPRADDFPRVQRTVGGPSMARVVDAVGTALGISRDGIRHGRGGVPRMVAAWIAWNDAMLTCREIADGLRLRSAGHAWNVVRRCDAELSGNRILQRCIDRCVSTLGGKNEKPKLRH